MKALIPTTLLVTLALGLGVWVGAAVLGGGAAADDGHDDHGHSHGAAPAAAPGKLDPRTLENLGVRIARLETVDHTTTVDVMGEIVARPDSRHEVTAWFGGRVETVHVAPGDHVVPGAPLVTLLRDPIPRPELRFTGELLAPGSERLHHTLSELLTARERLASGERELARLQALDGPEVEVRVVERQRLIDLEREIAVERRTVETYLHELERHGLLDAEIDAILAGSAPPPGPALWKRALEQAGLWGPDADALAAALPESQAKRPWTVASIGELNAAGVLLAPVTAALAGAPELGVHFETAASLLLSGESIEHVAEAARAGALAPRHTLRVPGDRELDVEALHVATGSTVSAGAPLLELVDASTMWLRVSPSGAEVEWVERALTAPTALSARPVVRGSGPALDGVRLRFLRGHEGADQPHAFAVVPNQLVAAGPDGERTWALRTGTPYAVRLPSRHFEGVLLLEPSGVATSGPDRLVFVQDGASYRAAPVRVLHEDAEVAVVAADGAFHEGDPIVVSGALALSQALQTGGPVDPHAGHSH